jgi:DNA repair ATPase RecN
MSDESWEKQFKQFLRKTGEDCRRTGEEIKAEAQRLLDVAMDPDKQQRVRNRLNELTRWARKAAQGVAGAVEEAASRAAETVFPGAADKVTEATASRKPAVTAKKASRAKVKPGKPRQKNGGKRKG